MPATQVLSRKVRSFLRKPRLARLCTIDRKGFPHVIPIYFMRQGDDILFGTDRGEAKVKNALRNPKGAVVIGGDPDEDDEGYMIQGILKVEPDPTQATTRLLLLRYESEEEAETQLSQWDEGNTVLIRLKPKRVIRVW
jgi:nitroimidazol reductase NimA-like FMN-containing flavoprotein (pyridoxamine 5'-phosphate oxidase superfamily)